MMDDELDGLDLQDVASPLLPFRRALVDLHLESSAVHELPPLDEGSKGHGRSAGVHCFGRCRLVVLLSVGVVLMLWVGIDGYFAFYQTGSLWVSHPYEWYSLSNSVARQRGAQNASGVYGAFLLSLQGVDNFTDYTNWTHVCPSSHRLPLPSIPQLQKTLSSSVPPTTVTQVHLSGDFSATQPLAFLWSHVLRSSPHSLHSTNCSGLSSALLNEASPPPVLSENDAHPPPRQCLSLPDYHLEFVLIPFPPLPSDMAVASRLILALDHDQFGLATDNPFTEASDSSNGPEAGAGDDWEGGLQCTGTLAQSDRLSSRGGICIPGVWRLSSDRQQSDVFMAVGDPLSRRRLPCQLQSTAQPPSGRSPIPAQPHGLIHHREAHSSTGIHRGE